jgi:hypothetical protein
MTAFRDRRVTAGQALAAARSRTAELNATLAGIPSWLQVGDSSRLTDPADRAAATEAAATRAALERAAHAAAELEAELDGIDAPRPPDIQLFLRWSAWLEGLASGAQLLAELQPDPRRLFLGAEPQMSPQTAARIIQTIAQRGGRVGDGQTFVAQAGLSDDDVFDLDHTASRQLDPLPAGQSIGVLLPVRLETRYRPRATPDDPWVLQVRVFPDPIATDQQPADATAAEAQAVADCWTQAGGELDSAAGTAAWSALVSAVGGPRAAHLLRTVPVIRQDGGFACADPPERFRRQGDTTTFHRLALPDVLTLWADRGAGLERLGELRPDHEAIAAQTDFAALRDQIRPDAVPATWWTSYAVAVKLGLATEIGLGAEPSLRVLLVTGLAEPAAALPFATLAERGVLGLLTPMAPTNTVAGTPAADLGDSAGSWLAAARDDSDEDATAVAYALAGAPLPGLYVPQRTQPSPLTIAGTFVRALWPVLWQRMIKDVGTGGEDTWLIGEWAGRLLAPLGPWPAIRVDDLPYGLLPSVDLDRWVTGPADPPWEAGLRGRLQALLPSWAAAAENGGTVAGADADRLLDLLGRVPTSRELGARLLLPLELRVLLSAALDDPDSQSYLRRWREAFQPWGQLGLEARGRFWPYGWVQPVAAKGEPFPDTLRRYLRESWETLAFTADLSQGFEPSFPARLIRHALLLTQAEVNRLQPDQLPSWQPPLELPLDDSRQLANLAQGPDRVPDLPRFARDALGAQPPDPRIAMVCRQFLQVRTAVRDLISLGGQFAADGPGSAALAAVADTSSHRIDPWVTALGTRRLRRLTARGVARRLGAYGWVDDLSPSADPTPPTMAGLLHAPSHGQALTAAVLRDKAIAAADAIWQLQIDSAGARLAKRLGDDVRLGIHLSEALGREIERRAGEPGRVVELRRRFSARPEWAGRRVCDGLKVLAAVEAGEPDLAWLGPLTDLRQVLDTYGDLLVADAVHDVTSGRAGQAQEAMEAAAGLAAPAELRFLRTQRAGTSVKTTVLAALPAATAAPGAGPAAVADPMVAALARQLAPAMSWTFQAQNQSVTLSDLGLDTSDAMLVPDDRLRSLVQDRLGPVDGGTHAAARAELTRLTALLGPQAGLPAVLGAGTGEDQLRTRLAQLRSDAAAVLTALRADPPDLAAALRWGLPADAPDAAGVLAGRLAEIGPAAGDDSLGPAGLAGRIRALLSPTETLPLLCAGPLPGLTAAAELDRNWLEILAAVRPAMARLEAAQMRWAWPAACQNPARLWSVPQRGEHQIIAYGPAATDAGPVGVALLDAWAETVPSSQHATWAAFGYDSPRARPPQAVLLAVPPDESRPLDAGQLPGIVLATRQLARARMVQPDQLGTWTLGVPSSLLLATGPAAVLVEDR